MILKTVMGLGLLLLVCGGWQCNTALVEELVPAVEEETSFDLWGLIHDESGTVHSPIPDDVYSILWGEWEKEWVAGLEHDETGRHRHVYAKHPDSDAPRRYFMKYMDADGIAIVGGSHIDDKLFHAARGVVRAMMWKIPEVREVLSLTPGRLLNPPSGTGPENWNFFSTQFRVVLLDPQDVENWRIGLDHVPGESPCRRPNGEVAGGCGGRYRAVAEMWSVDLGDHTAVNGESTLVHEMAHTIHAVFDQHPELFPDFQSRLEAAYETEMARLEAGDVLCFWENAYAHTNVMEYWAEAVSHHWFYLWHWATSDPTYKWTHRRGERKSGYSRRWPPEEFRNPPGPGQIEFEDYPNVDAARILCGDMVDLISEVFPAF